MKSYPVSGKRSSVVLRPQSVGKRRGGVWQPRGELSRAILIFGIERPRQVDHGDFGSRRATIRRSAFTKALCKSVDKMLLHLGRKRQKSNRVQVPSDSLDRHCQPQPQLTSMMHQTTRGSKSAVASGEHLISLPARPSASAL